MLSAMFVIAPLVCLYDCRFSRGVTVNCLFGGFVCGRGYMGDNFWDYYLFDLRALVLVFLFFRLCASPAPQTKNFVKSVHVLPVCQHSLLYSIL